jgi:hypothetical protein
LTKVLYIMGHGYSGSTLLTFLLGNHPEIATIGELGIAPRAKTRPEEFLCSCRAPIRDCGFWRRVGREMAERGHPFDVWDADLDFRARGGGLADVILRAVQRGPILETARNVGVRVVPAAGRELSRTLDRIESLAEVVTGIKECSTFLDSSKRPERAVFMRRVPSFDLKVIHLVRDGRAVSFSSMKNLGIGPEQAADSWVGDNRASEQALRWFPKGRLLRVRYEDLCADPPGTLRRIHRFAGVTPGNGHVALDKDGQHVIGNRMRLSSTSEVRLDEKWKRSLAPEHLEVIERRVGTLNRRYGYGGL